MAVSRYEPGGLPALRRMAVSAAAERAIPADRAARGAGRRGGRTGRCSGSKYSAQAAGAAEAGRCCWPAGPRRTGCELARRDVGADELRRGPVALDFSVPLDLSLEAGADAPFDIRLHHLGDGVAGRSKLGRSDQAGRPDRGCRRRRRRRRQSQHLSFRAPQGRHHRQLPVGNAAPGLCPHRAAEPAVRREVPFHPAAEKPARIRGARSGDLRHPADPGHPAVGRISAARLRAARGRCGTLSAGALRLAVAVRRLERAGRQGGVRARGAEPDLPVSRRSARPAAPGNPGPGGAVSAPIVRSTCRGSSITAGCTSWKSAASAAWTRSSTSRSARSSWKISRPGGYSTRRCGRIGRCSAC